MKTVSDTLPPFELRDQNGSTVRDSDLRGIGWSSTAIPTT